MLHRACGRGGWGGVSVRDIWIKNAQDAPEAVTTKEPSRTQHLLLHPALVRCCPQQGRGSSQALFVAEICDPKRSLSSSGSAQRLREYLVIIKSAISSETMFGKALVFL